MSPEIGLWIWACSMGLCWLCFAMHQPVYTLNVLKSCELVNAYVRVSSNNHTSGSLARLGRLAKKQLLLSQLLRLL